MLSHPNRSAVLGAAVARSFLHRLLLAHIPHADLLVARRRHEHITAGVPRQALHDVAVLEDERRLAGTNIPDFDVEVAGRGGEDVFGGWVEEDLPDFPVQMKSC